MADNIKNRESVSTSAEHRDGVSLLPWRVIKAYDDEPARIIDADDDEVAVELIDADAALIVEAVNELARRREAVKAEVARRELGPAMIQELTDESRRLLAERDRLRELMRRLADIVRHDCDERAMALTREAYAAIGEEVPE